MTTIEKLEILSAAAKYDASCASSGSNRKGKFGTATMPGICHSWAADGRCISLLKVLLSNNCMYRCAYCVNSAEHDTPRATFEPTELCDLTEAFYRRNYIEGLFLSSAVFKSPDHTMERMIEVLRIMRDRGFGGYIHVKAIPGASQRLIDRAGRLADRISVNIELPSQSSLKLLAPNKEKDAILKPMSFIKNRIIEQNDTKSIALPDTFAPAGQSTQLIVGASPESDHQILKLSEGLYKKFSMRRVYYSAYIPTTSHPNLPAINKPPLLREHRLYQADWLLRFYGFEASEILDEKFNMLDEHLDPKCTWAIRHPEYFPVEINKASLYELLRVPGIGNISARRIIYARRVGSLGFEDLKKLGIVMKRAVYFITCRGKFKNEIRMSPPSVYHALVSQTTTPQLHNAVQLSMFDPSPKEVLDTIPLLGAS